MKLVSDRETPETRETPAASARIDRRAVLRAGAAGSVLVVTLPLACGAPDAPALSNQPIVFGNVSTVPVGTMTRIPGVNGFLARDDSGLYVMSARCTHQGCSLPTPVSASALGVTCSCHGSQFDRNGAVLKGPATAPLQHYRVELAVDGTITVQGADAVDSDDRTPVL